MAPARGGTYAEAPPERPVLGSEIATREVTTAFASLATLPNPDPILRAEGRSISVYRSFVDGHLTSILGKRKAAVRSRSWTIEQGTADKYAFQRLTEIFDALPVRTMIGDALYAPPMGIVYQEIIWAQIQGWIAPVKVEAKPQEWFGFGPDMSLHVIGIGQRLIPVPPRKVLVTSHEASYTNPYGTPILSSCFWPLSFKRGGLKFWALFCERFGIPRTVGKVPASTPEPDREKLMSALKSMVRDAVAVIPNNASIDLLETKISGALPFPDLVKWADSEMSKAVLGETLTTETQGNSGNRALGEVHDKVRGDIAMDDANLVEETMNQLIRWIWELNRPGDMNLPRFVIQMPEDLQMGKIERDTGLYKLGARFTPQYFLDTFGVAPHHLAGVDAMRTGAAASFSEHAHGCRCRHGHSNDFAEASELETLLRSFTPQELQSQVAELVQPIIDLAERSGGVDEFSQALDELFPHLTTRQMEASLEKCMLLAEMQGKANAKPS